MLRLVKVLFAVVRGVAALALAFALCGCSDSDTSSSWFSKPLKLFGINLGYTYSQLGDARQDRPITANDLVDPNGACPRYVAPSPQSRLEQGLTPAVRPRRTAAASLLGAGVAIGMSECDVVARLGQPTAVNVGRNPNGDRGARS